VNHLDCLFFFFLLFLSPLPAPPETDVLDALLNFPPNTLDKADTGAFFFLVLDLDPLVFLVLDPLVFLVFDLDLDLDFFAFFFAANKLCWVI
jgi:hypothetical protein